MSAAMERRVRKMYTEGETPQMIRSIVTDSRKKQKSNFLSLTEFNSETFTNSSPSNTGVVSVKTRRKKIRCTEEINHLDNRLFSQDSDEPSRKKSKKTKKTKTAYHLPNISRTVEDLSANRHGNSDESDSDIEIVKKKKKKLKKKDQRKSGDGDETNWESKYMERVKLILSGKSKSADISNSSSLECSSNENVSEKLTRSSRKIASTPHFIHTPGSSHIVAKGVKNGSDNKTENKVVKKRSALGSNILRPSESEDLDFDSDDVFENTLQNEVIETDKINNNRSNDLSITVKTRKSVRIKSGDENDLPSATKDTTVVKLKVNERCNDKVNTPRRISVRKSSSNVIESKSPCHNVSENQKLCHQSNKHCEENVSKQSGNNKIKSKYSLQLLSSASKTPRKSTSEQKNAVAGTSEITKQIKPVVFNSEKLEENNSVDTSVQVMGPAAFSKEDEVSQKTSIGKNKHSATNLSVCENFKFKLNDQTIEQIQYFSHSLQSNTLPALQHFDNHDSSRVNKRKCWNKSRPSTSFLSNSVEVINISTSCEEDDYDKTLNNSASKLHRSSTFTVDDEPNQQTENLPYSPLQLDTSYVKPSDTSKVNKRRRWDKSRRSTSFLDNSFALLMNTSEPCELDCDTTLNNLDINESQQNINALPCSSTPLLENKNNSTGAVPKRKSAVPKKNRNMEKPLPKFRNKLPNFALIHQKAFDKLENIKEMSERKAARAKLLLSGHKPPAENVSKTSSRRKELKFSPTIKEKNKGLNKLNISITKIKKISPSKTSVTVANKENRLISLEKQKELQKIKSHIPKPKKPVPVIGESKSFTRFGFKVGTDSVKVTKEEQVKAVASKSKIMKNTLEERRNIIQGVRSNRRFELLMQMRNK